MREEPFISGWLSASEPVAPSPKRRVRPWFIALAGLGLVLLGFDQVQTWVYLNRLPQLPAYSEKSAGPELTCSVLVAGAGLDRAEEATGVRDLAAAREALLGAYPGSHKTWVLHPESPGYSAQAFQETVQKLPECERVIVYLTGHGGGFNFGANSRFNLSKDAILEQLAEVRCQQLLVLVDCCWSGQFAQGLDQRSFASPLTLITSTDAKHPAPFPVSFLSPHSFGRMWFERLEMGERAAFDATNQRRSTLKSLYPEEIGLSGTWTSLAPLPQQDPEGATRIEQNASSPENSFTPPDGARD